MRSATQTLDIGWLYTNQVSTNLNLNSNLKSSKRSLVLMSVRDVPFTRKASKRQKTEGKLEKNNVLIILAELILQLEKNNCRERGRGKKLKLDSSINVIPMCVCIKF